MGAMHKELVISVADLRYVCIRCQTWRTTVTLDRQEPPKFRENHTPLLQSTVPVAERNMTLLQGRGIDDLHRVFKLLSRVKNRISFRGKAEES